MQTIEYVNLNIYKNSVIGLVGGNGARKTTLLRLMSGVYRPTEGTVIDDDRPVTEMRSVLGVVPEPQVVFQTHCMGKHSIPQQTSWDR